MRLLAMGVMLAILTGCWPLAMNPLYEADEGEMPERLEGIWREDGENTSTYEFVVDPNRRGYDLKVTDTDKRTVLLKATVVRLGEAMFLDATPVWGQDEVPAWYGMTSVPLHAIFRLELTPDGELFLTPIKEDVLVKRLEIDPKLIEHRMVNVFNENGDAVPRPILTAPTKDLRNFAEQHAKDVDLFADPAKLTRTGNSRPGL